MNSRLLQQILRGLWVLIIISAILLALFFVTPLVYPFLIGFFIAYILNPVVNLLHRQARFPRWLSVTLTLLLFLGLTTVSVILILTNIIVEISNLSKTIQDSINIWTMHVNRFLQSAYVQHIIQQANEFYLQNPNIQGTINSNLQSTGQKLANMSSNVITNTINAITHFITLIPGFATVLVIAILAAFFISKDWYVWQARIASLFSERMRQTGRLIWLDLQKALFGYVRTQLILISITAAIITIGLSVLGAPYAVAMGLLTGLIDLLPYLGVGAIMIPWIIVTFIQGNIYFGIGLSIVYGLVLVTRQLVEPKVLSSSVGLEPLPTLTAMFVGLKLFGVKGLIIGPVTFVIIATFHRANVFRELRQYILQGRAIK